MEIELNRDFFEQLFKEAGLEHEFESIASYSVDEDIVDANTFNNAKLELIKGIAYLYQPTYLRRTDVQDYARQFHNIQNKLHSIGIINLPIINHGAQLQIYRELNNKLGEFNQRYLDGTQKHLLNSKLGVLYDKLIHRGIDPADNDYTQYKQLIQQQHIKGFISDQMMEIDNQTFLTGQTESLIRNIADIKNQIEQQKNIIQKKQQDLEDNPDNYIAQADKAIAEAKYNKYKEKLEEMELKQIDKAQRRDAILYQYLSEPMVMAQYKRMVRNGQIDPKNDSTEKQIQIVHDEIIKNMDKIKRITMKDTVPLIKEKKEKQQSKFHKKLKSKNKYLGQLFKINHLKSPILKALQSKTFSTNASKKEIDTHINQHLDQQIQKITQNKKSVLKRHKQFNKQQKPINKEQKPIQQQKKAPTKPKVQTLQQVQKKDAKQEEKQVQNKQEQGKMIDQSSNQSRLKQLVGEYKKPKTNLKQGIIENKRN